MRKLHSLSFFVQFPAPGPDPELVFSEEMAEYVTLHTVEEPPFDKVVVGKTRPMRARKPPRETLQTPARQDRPRHARAVCLEARNRFVHLGLPVCIASMLLYKLAERRISVVIHRRGKVASRAVQDQMLMDLIVARVLGIMGQSFKEAKPMSKE